jgi:hypothetical protein
MHGVTELLEKAYISDVFPPWTMTQQELVLAAIPGWPEKVVVYRDHLDRLQWRGKNANSLTDRAELLRTTSRKEPNRIYVASLAILAWEENDFRAVVDAVMAHDGMITSVDDKFTISRDVSLDQAVSAWNKSRKRSRTIHVKSKGARISAERKKAIAAIGVAKIKQYWGMSADEWPTPLLRQMAGSPGKPMAYNTIVEHLGVGRSVARKRHQASLKRKLTMEAQGRAGYSLAEIAKRLPLPTTDENYDPHGARRR